MLDLNEISMEQKTKEKEKQREVKKNRSYLFTPIRVFTRWAHKDTAIGGDLAEYIDDKQKVVLNRLV